MSIFLGAVKSNKKYYAIINILKKPKRIITSSKTEMVKILNLAYKKQTGEKKSPYSISDFDENRRIYMNTKLPTYISDDWALVTDKYEIFKENIK